MKEIGRLKTFESKDVDKSYVSIGFECLDRDVFNPDKCYDLLAKSGVKYARCQTGWARCEKQKGVYDFAWLDAVIDHLWSRGVIPWLNIGYGNPIYMADISNPTGVGCVPFYYGEEAMAAWKNFVRVITERYKDKVQCYEIWNEPNGTGFWYPKTPNGKEFAEFANITAAVIRSVKNDAKIGVNVFSPYLFGYIDNVIKNIEVLDFFAIHTYSTIPEFRYSRAVKRLRRTLDENGFTETEIWQGEGGYPSWAYKGHWLVKDGCDDERAQAIWQLRRYFLDISNGIKLSSFFQMADMWEKPYETATKVIKKPAGHGILNGITYTPKESYRTISHLAAIFNGDIVPTDEYIQVYIKSESPLETLACQTMTFTKNGIPVYAYYLPTALEKYEEIPYCADIGVDKLNDPVLIDPYSGAVYAVDEAHLEETVSYSWLNSSFFEYKDMPVKDYPLILTEARAFDFDKSEVK